MPPKKPDTTKTTEEQIEYIIEQLPKSKYINTIHNIIYMECKNIDMIINVSAI